MNSASPMLPLALIHGWGQHGGIWCELLARLEREGGAPEAVCNCELPGHGAAPSGDFELDALSESYAAQAPAACAVIGWSLGGLIALRWAQRQPQQVRKLILFGSTPCFGVRPDWVHGAPAEVQQAFAAQVEADPARALQRFADLLAAGEMDVRGVRNALRASLAAAPVPSAAMLMAGLRLLAATDLRASLRTDPPNMPTLVIHGEDDTITPFGAGRWLAETLPQARLLALPGCGHAPMVSHVEPVEAAIKAFLEEPV